MFIKSCGKLIFRRTSIIVEVDDNIREYYYNLIPKYFYPQRQMHKCHITVVRTGYETWPSSINWTGRIVEFEYENKISFDGIYFFLRVLSDDIGKIRQSLGLTFNRWKFDCYHITIGNIKNDSSRTT